METLSLKASDPSLGGVSGFGQVGDAEGIGNFTLKEFGSHELFDAYVSSLDYGSDKKPAICFGFKASGKDLDFELELMFSDQNPIEYTSIPS
jgi:hypothetical protein